jgi:peptidyl-prolyl cis-trans isomerase SurA
VEPQVQEAVYLNALQPALRAYLTKQREEAYVDIKPGFVDSGSNRREAQPKFTAYTPPPVKKKTEAKRRVEQQKDALAQQHLAEVRAQAAEKAAAKAAKAGGATNVSMVKTKKVKREKIRYGQAPRTALPSAPLTAVQGADAPLAGQAPGVAMADTSRGATIVTRGTGNEAVPEEDPLAPKVGPQKKTRYTARQADIELAKANDKAKKASEHIAARPVAATQTETAAEKVQAAPLGLQGDTTKKPAKAKRKKGDPKERLQEKPKPVDTTPTVAPTVNPTLGGSAIPASTAPPGATTPTPSTAPTPTPPPPTL